MYSDNNFPAFLRELCRYIYFSLLDVEAVRASECWLVVRFAASHNRKRVYNSERRDKLNP
jgi:hypothetical protein